MSLRVFYMMFTGFVIDRTEAKALDIAFLRVLEVVEYLECSDSD